MKDKIKQHPFLFSALMYTLLFAVFFIVYVSDSVYMFANDSDVRTQFLPTIAGLKKFYGDLLSGSFAAVDYKMLFGTELLFAGGMPLNPFNFILIFMSEEQLPFYFKIYYTVSMYFSGIAFMKMCTTMDMKPYPAALAALLYVFSPYDLRWNIIYASPATMITAPLMIAGMEKIFRKKGCGLLFAASVLTAVTGGFYMFAFQLAVTVIYAFVKVIFIKEDNFFKRLWYYGWRGALAAFCGLAAAAAVALPQLVSILSSSRISEVRDSIVKQAFEPDAAMLISSLTSNTAYFAPGVLISALIIVFFVLKKAPAMHKILLGLCFMGVFLPAFSALLCAFTYIEHRWAFGFAMAGAYAAGYVIENIRKADLPDRIWSCAALIIYLFLYESITENAALAALAIFIVIMNIPPVRKQLDRFLTVINDKEQHILEVIVYLVFAMFTAILLAVTNDLSILFAVVVVLVTITVCCTEKDGKKLKYLFTVFPAAALPAAILLEILPGVQRLGDNEIEQFPQLYPLKEIQAEDNAGGDEIVRFESIDNKTYYNVGYSHGLAMPNIFTNLLPSGYTQMMKEAEYDYYTHGSVNIVTGYEHRLPFLSVWGIDYIHQEPDIFTGETDIFGSLENVYINKVPSTFDEVMSYEFEGREQKVYKNNFCLPFGFTYDAVCSDTERMKLNGADYGINMMYSAAVGAAEEEGAVPCVSPVSFEVPCSVSSELYRYDAAGDITYTKYTFTPDEPICGSEVYVTVKGVDPYSNRFGTFTVMLDGDETAKINGEFGGELAAESYDWFSSQDSYTICVSDRERIETVDVVVSCEFEDIIVTAYPVSEYKAQYERLSEYTMENTVLGADEITGNITVPDDRILCLQLQYSDGWQAYDNGKKTDIICVNTCMTGIRLSPGEHNIRLVYHVPGLAEGVAVSCTAIAAVVVLTVINKRRKKQTADE